MYRTNDPFVFAVNQEVCWLQPGGPRYLIMAAVYVKGLWPQGFTALPPQPLIGASQALYLVRPVHNILGEFWARQEDLYCA